MKAKQELKTILDKIRDPCSINRTQINENIQQIEKEISTICSERNSSIVKSQIAELEQVCRLNN